MPNFACQNRDDERYLTNALQQQGLGGVKVVVVTGNIDEPFESETAQLGNYGVVASLNEVREGRCVCKQLELQHVCVWRGGSDSSGRRA
jgi:hypothetical protein